MAGLLDVGDGGCEASRSLGLAPMATNALQRLYFAPLGGRQLKAREDSPSRFWSDVFHADL